MEYKTFLTVAKRNEINNEMHVFGVIQGLQVAICDIDSPTLGYDCELFPDFMIYRTNTTKERYKKFREVVEKIYPGLCQFDNEES